MKKSISYLIISVLLSATLLPAGAADLLFRKHHLSPPGKTELSAFKRSITDTDLDQAELTALPRTTSLLIRKILRCHTTDERTTFGYKLEDSELILDIQNNFVYTWRMIKKDSQAALTDLLKISGNLHKYISLMDKYSADPEITKSHLMLNKNVDLNEYTADINKLHKNIKLLMLIILKLSFLSYTETTLRNVLEIYPMSAFQMDPDDDNFEESFLVYLRYRETMSVIFEDYSQYWQIYIMGMITDIYNYRSAHTTPEEKQRIVTLQKMFCYTTNNLRKMAYIEEQFLEGVQKYIIFSAHLLERTLMSKTKFREIIHKADSMIEVESKNIMDKQLEHILADDSAKEVEFEVPAYGPIHFRLTIFLLSYIYKLKTSAITYVQIIDKESFWMEKLKTTAPGAKEASKLYMKAYENAREVLKGRRRSNVLELLENIFKEIVRLKPETSDYLNSHLTTPTQPKLTTELKSLITSL